MFERFGSRILSRQNIRNLNEQLIDRDAPITLDFSRVEFISRSVADELVSMQEANQDIRFENLLDEVMDMIVVVERSRKETRRRRPSAKISTMVYCDTLEDVKRALRS